MAGSTIHTNAGGTPSGGRTYLDPDYYDEYYDNGYGYGYGAWQRVDVVESAQPLVTRLEEYDAVYMRLMEQGGTSQDLRTLSDLLATKFRLGSSYRRRDVCLAERGELNRTLWDISWGELHLDVRQLEEGWPVYYLSRTHSDYYSNYGFILEDLHQARDYPFVDERFVGLMVHGHEEQHLRLSHLRATLAESRLLGKKPTQDELDDALLLVGKHVLQAAWHEDQRIGMLVSQALGIPQFGQAIELLYLCLSGELCELRGQVGDFLLGFFGKVLPHPPIRELLSALPGMSGEDLTRLPQLALRRYTDLARAFNAFLGTPVKWKSDDVTIPLYKLVFANISRFETIAKAIARQSAMKQGVRSLSDVSQQITQSLLDSAFGRPPADGQAWLAKGSG